MVYPTCKIAGLGLAWLWLGCASSWLWAQGGPAAVAEVQLEEPLANSPMAIALRTMHRFEKAFLVRACDLSDEQKRALDKLDDNWKVVIPKQENEAARQAIGGGVVVIQGAGNVMIRARGNTNVNEDAFLKYRKSLRTKFNTILTPVQRGIYEQELKARDEFKRQVAAEVLVAALDNVLGLKPEQREGLTKTLTHWPDNENLHLAYYLQNEGFLPVIPDALLTKHLNGEQLSIYRQARRSDARMSQVLFDGQQEPFGE